MLQWPTWLSRSDRLRTDCRNLSSAVAGYPPAPSLGRWSQSLPERVSSALVGICWTELTLCWLLTDWLGKLLSLSGIFPRRHMPPPEAAADMKLGLSRSSNTGFPWGGGICCTTPPRPQPRGGRPGVGREDAITPTSGVCFHKVSG